MSQRKLGWMIVVLAVGLTVSACSATDSGTADQDAVNHAHEQSADGHQHTVESDKKEIPSSVAWTFAPDTVKANEIVNYSLTVKDDADQTMKAFQISHDKKLHLLVISRDLQVFQHLHPDQAEDGSFRGSTTLPQAGDYQWIADYIPEGGMQTIRQNWTNDPNTSDDIPQLIADPELLKTVNGVKIKLDTPNLGSGKDVPLTFHFADEASGAELNDLQPYLGATGHLVIVDPALETYLHTHPLDSQSTGPTSTFLTNFPKPGLYKMWGQFQRDGKPLIVPFTIQVP